MRNNLHLVFNSFNYKSRVLKETKSLIDSGLVDHIYIAAFYQDGLLEHEELDGNRSIWRMRLKSRSLPKLMFFRMFKYIEYCIKTLIYAAMKNIKIITIHCLALLPFGVFLKIIFNVSLVYDAHELETEINGLCGVKQSVSRFIERVLIKHVDLVMVVSDGIKQWYKDNYGIFNIVSILNCPVFQRPEKSKKLHENLSISKDKKIVLYQGGFVPGRGIRQLLNCFSEKNDGQFVLVFMGYGRLEPLIRSYSKIYNNIFLHKAVPPDVVLEYTASADVGVAYIDNPSLNDYYCLPNKLFEYIMAGLPVIINDVPEMRSVVENRNIGIVLEKLTSNTISDALQKIHEIDLNTLSANLKSAADTYCWERQEKVMLEGHRKFVLKNENF